MRQTPPSVPARPLPPCVGRGTRILTCDLAAGYGHGRSPPPPSVPARPLPPYVGRGTRILTCDLAAGHGHGRTKRRGLLPAPPPPSVPARPLPPCVGRGTRILTCDLAAGHGHGRTKRRGLFPAPPPLYLPAPCLRVWDEARASSLVTWQAKGGDRQTKKRNKTTAPGLRAWSPTALLSRPERA